MRHVLLPLTPLASEVITTVTGFGRHITVRGTLNLGYATGVRISGKLLVVISM